MITNKDFTASTAYPLFLRSYSRTALDGTKETALEAKNRAITGLKDFKWLSEEEVDLIRKYFYKNLIFPSGRWFWVGGTDWVKQQKNFIGAYNCASIPIDKIDAFGFTFRALLMGCGVGGVVEENVIEKLPTIQYPIEIKVVKELGSQWVEDKATENSYFYAEQLDQDNLTIDYVVGDSKEGWVSIATHLLEFASTKQISSTFKKIDYKSIILNLDLSQVRPKGKVLKSFGGLSNPEKLLSGLLQIVSVLNRAVGRKLNSLEGTKLLCIYGVITVVADIRRSALLEQGSPGDKNFTDAKLGLWYQDEQGNWKADSEKDMLRMANLTVSYHVKPNLETTIEAVRKQFYSGEGAIQYVPEAVARANADILDTPEKKQAFIDCYVQSIRKGANYLLELVPGMDNRELEHRIRRYGLNPCGEIIGNTFFCCLSDVHANLLDPLNIKQQEEAFRASTLTALPLLQHEFDIEELRYSREIDPIIGVCITGLFDFFVNLFGADWLRWWKTGRDKSYKKADYFLETEREYLTRWKNVVKDTVVEFCQRNGIRVPNRYTAIAPSGSKSLLTGASAGWHPPKATRYIRRITYRVKDPVALACRDYGYSIIPSQDCKDEEGRLLNDPYDPRVTEWLVEIPVEVNWAKIGDEADFNPKDCSALAQLDFYMQVHNYYVTHSTSATIELSEDEIEPLGTAIHSLIDNDGGYISAALLAKFEAKETFPRLPFEPITEAKYLEEMRAVKRRQTSTDFVALVNSYSKGFSFVADSGSVGCDSDKCLMPEKR